MESSATSPAAVVVLIGPSAAGKSTVARHLEQRGVARILPTWTTRPRRPDEHDTCPEHRFVTDAEFDELVAGGFFVATGGHAGLPHRYGLPYLDAAGPLPLVVARARAVPAVAAITPVVTYQLVADLPTLARRLAARKLHPPETAARLATAAAEIRAGVALGARQFHAGSSTTEVCDAVEAALALDLPMIPSRPQGAAA